MPSRSLREAPRIGIVGSRDWEDEARVRALVASLLILYSDYTLVSGGAYKRTQEWRHRNPDESEFGGVDYWAEDQAKIAGIPTDIMYADWGVFGKIAGIMRNEELIDSCDKVYIFWDGKSPGTRHLIQYCKRKKKDFEVIGPDAL